MNTQPALSRFSKKKGNQFDSLLSFIMQLMDIQIQPIQGGNILEIGSDVLLSRPHLKTAVRFNDNMPENADIICDENYLPFSATHDLIICPLSLHFAKSPKTHLNQLISILKPGGQLVLTTFGHYSLHEIRTLINDNLDLDLLEFIHPSQLKSWLPTQGKRDMIEDWIILKYGTFLDFIADAKSLNFSSFIKGIDQLTPDNIQLISENFEGSFSFQIITLTYKKPHFMRDE